MGSEERCCTDTFGFQVGISAPTVHWNHTDSRGSSNKMSLNSHYRKMAIAVVFMVGPLSPGRARQESALGRT